MLGGMTRYLRDTSAAVMGVMGAMGVLRALRDQPRQQELQWTETFLNV
jgi:hypothetical protein